MQTVQADLEGAHRLLEGTFKRAVEGEHFPRRLHLGTQLPVGGGELVERPPRKLDRAVIEDGLRIGTGPALASADFVEM